jgi:hypothetical protein
MEMDWNEIGNGLLEMQDGAGHTDRPGRKWGLQFFPIRPMTSLEPLMKSFGFHATIQQYGLQKKLKAQRGRGEN